MIEVRGRGEKDIWKYRLEAGKERRRQNQELDSADLRVLPKGASGTVGLLERITPDTKQVPKAPKPRTEMISVTIEMREIP